MGAGIAQGRAAERSPEVSSEALEEVRAWFAGDASGVRGRWDKLVTKQKEETDIVLNER